MMSARGIVLESFDGAGNDTAGNAHVPEQDAEEVEKLRLEAYEAGYRSGWDDCAASAQEDLARVGAELERNISDLGFTYYEARNQMMAEVKALLGELFGELLPGLARHALQERIIDDIGEALDAALEVPVELTVSPNVSATIEGLLPNAAALPLRLVQDESLADDQAFMRFGETETSYDFGALVGRLLTALASDGDRTVGEAVNE